MRKGIFLLCLASAAVCAADSPYEIVLAPDAPKTVRFAAREMSTLLGGVLGEQPKTVVRPTAGKRHLFLGAGQWADAVGVSASALARDAFRLKAVGNDVYIVGRDDAAVDPDRLFERGIWVQLYERATLFGVYEFLERYAGVRMYFPGELGTVTPRRTALDVPKDLDETVEPAFLVREYSTWSDGTYFEGDPYVKMRPEKVLNMLRLRMETTHIPCCHGQNAMKFLDRFGETHPEYFMLQKNGQRRTDPSVPHPGTICLTSGIWEEMYRDCEAYFTGKARGYAWGSNFREGTYADLMCQDGLMRCTCENCNRRLGTGRYWSTEVVWSNTCAIARRLKAAGIKGTVTQMAYTSYRGVPQTTEIPDNVRVMLAQRGPWSMRDASTLPRDLEELAAWDRKVGGGRRLWLWNYICKYRFLNLPDVPCVTPRAIGDYYKRVGPYICGAYMESDGDRFLYNHLNYAIFSRMCWHPETDVAAWLDEYYRLMYGAAAPEMKAAFELFEDKWVGELSNRTVDLPDGPLANPPCEHFLWHEIYGPKVIDRLEKLFDRAAARVRPDSLEGRRVALMRREMLEPLAARARQYWANAKPLTPKAGPDAVVLVATNGEFVTKTFLLNGRDKRYPRIEPFHRYRVSFNVEADGIEPVDRGGGAGIAVKDGHEVSFPRFTAFNGRFPRSRKVYEFLAGPETNRRGKTASLLVRMYWAKGRAVFDDIRIEEIPLRTEDVKPIVSAAVEETADEWRFTLTLDRPFMHRQHFRSVDVSGYLVYADEKGKTRKRAADRYDKNRNTGLLTGTLKKSQLPAGTKSVTFELYGRNVIDYVEIDLKGGEAK